MNKSNFFNFYTFVKEAVFVVVPGDDAFAHVVEFLEIILGKGFDPVQYLAALLRANL